MNRTIELTLPVSPTAPSMAREALWQWWPDASTSGRGSDAELLVSEIVTNCVRHAGLALGKPISFVMEVERERLRVEVMDVGRGFPRPTSTGVDGEGGSGWGLLLVEQLADEWGVSRSEKGETTVWFEMDL